jgi:hypothetical protein
MAKLQALQTLKLERFETSAILKKLNATSRALAELKGVAYAGSEGQFRD